MPCDECTQQPRTEGENATAVSPRPVRADTRGVEASRSPETGRFARRGVRDARTLYAILRAVAEAAVADRPTADPRKVTVRQWRDARHLCEADFGHIPLPQEIRRQLAKLNGELLPFPELLAVVFDEQRDTVHFHTKMQAEEPLSEAMSVRHVWYALRYVARSLDPEGVVRAEITLLPGQYERRRRELIAADLRRWKHGGHLASRLPTFRQIAHYTGTWDRALDMAELAPRPKTANPSRRSVSIAEAIVAFYERVGVLPTYKKLYRYAADYGFSLEGLRGRRYQPFLEQGIALIRIRELPEPPDYEQTKRLRLTWPLPEAPPQSAAPRGVHEHTLPQAVRAVIAYVATLGTGEAATQAGWRRHATGNPDIPSYHALARFGGLGVLVERAREPNALARADAEHEALLAEKQAAQIISDAEKPQAKAVLAAMEELGGDYMRMRELQERLGWVEATVIRWLRILRKAGKVELVERAERSRKLSRYRLVGAEVSADEAERRWLEAESRMPQARRTLAALAAHGPLSAVDLASRLGLSSDAARHWLAKLQAAGMVERVKGTDKRRRLYRLTPLGHQRAENTAEHS